MTGAQRESLFPDSLGEEDGSRCDDEITAVTRHFVAHATHRPWHSAPHSEPPHPSSDSASKEIVGAHPYLAVARSRAADSFRWRNQKRA